MNTEIILSWILRVGVLSGASLMAVGLLINPTIIWFGVLVLSLTPFARVLMAGICFLAQRDKTYFLIAAYIILVLVISYLIKL